MRLILIFYSDNLQLEIIDIFHFNRTKSKYFTPKRPFHILTKRISGYSDMIFENNCFRVTADNMLYIPANTEYTRQSYDNEEIIAIHFNILNREFFEPVLINVDEVKCNEFFKEMILLWTERKPGFKYKCIAALYEYLSTIIIKKNNSLHYFKLEKSINWIESNLSQKISISNLAKMCNLSETQYRKLFKIEFGVSPVKYINKLRVSNAISKLSSGYYSMAEISELCGFSSQKHFNKIFKSETKKSPTKYKKEYFGNNKRS